MNKVVKVTHNEIEKYGYKLALFIRGFLVKSDNRYDIVTNDLSNCMDVVATWDKNDNLILTKTNEPVDMDLNIHSTYTTLLREAMNVLKLTYAYFPYTTTRIPNGFHGGKINKIGNKILYRENLDLERVKYTLLPKSEKIKIEGTRLEEYKYLVLNGVKLDNTRKSGRTIWKIEESNDYDREVDTVTL